MNKLNINNKKNCEGIKEIEGGVEFKASKVMASRIRASREVRSMVVKEIAKVSLEIAMTLLAKDKDAARDQYEKNAAQSLDNLFNILDDWFRSEFLTVLGALIEGNVIHDTILMDEDEEVE